MGHVMRILVQAITAVWQGIRAEGGDGERERQGATKGGQGGGKEQQDLAPSPSNAHPQASSPPPLKKPQALLFESM